MGKKGVIRKDEEVASGKEKDAKVELSTGKEQRRGKGKEKLGNFDLGDRSVGF